MDAGTVRFKMSSQNKLTILKADVGQNYSLAFPTLNVSFDLFPTFLPLIYSSAKDSLDEASFCGCMLKCANIGIVREISFSRK